MEIINTHTHTHIHTYIYLGFGVDSQSDARFRRALLVENVCSNPQKIFVSRHFDTVPAVSATHNFSTRAAVEKGN